MILDSFPTGPLDVNCVVVGDEGTREAFVVDPGGDGPRILAALAKHGLTLKAVLHTHGHIDHVGATAELCRAAGVKAHMHPDDGPLYQALPVFAQMLGMPAPASVPMEPLQDGQVLALGGLKLRVVHTPGHTMGSVCFLVEGEGVLLSGDTLFRRGVGRTDLGGDWDTLVRSIRERLFPLGDAVKVLPGHNGATTLGEERRENPFLP